MTRIEAIAFLQKRYAEQVILFPRTAGIPLSLYIRRNLKGAMLLVDMEHIATENFYASDESEMERI